MIVKEEDDGRERVTEDEERVRRINRDQISKIARLSSSKNFVCKKESYNKH